MKHHRSARDRRYGLRSIERFVQDVVAAQPSPPRQFATWDVVSRSLAPATWFLLIVMVGLLLMQEVGYRTQPFAARPLNYYVVVTLAMIVLLNIVVRDVIQCMYRWWINARRGRYTVARITAMQERLIPYGGRVIDGHWQFAIDATTVTHTFRLSGFWSGAWIWRVDVGSEVHILVHPTKPMGMVAIGIVNDAAPRLTQPDEHSLLAELLASHPVHHTIRDEEAQREKYDGRPVKAYGTKDDEKPPNGWPISRLRNG